MLLRTFFGKIGPIKHLHVVFDLREMNDALAPDIYSEFRIKMEKHVKTNLVVSLKIYTPVN